MSRRHCGLTVWGLGDLLRVEYLPGDHVRVICYGRIFVVYVIVTNFTCVYLDAQACPGQ